MSKKIKLEFTGQELVTFNQVWNVEMDWYQDKDFDRIVELVAEELAAKFLKKAIDRKPKKNTITLKEYEAIALKVYLDIYMDWSDSGKLADVYQDQLIRKYYRLLDQKTV